MTTIPSIVRAPQPQPDDLLQRLGVIASPGMSPVGYSIPGLTLPQSAATVPAAPRPRIAPPTAQQPTPDPIAQHAAAMMAGTASPTPGRIESPGAPPSKPLNLTGVGRIEPAAPKPPGMAAVESAKAAEAAIKPPQYTGKLGLLEKVGDAASRLLAPGIEHSLGIGTIGYQDRLTAAKAATQEAEKEAATEAGTAHTAAQADLAKAQADKLTHPAPTANDFQIESTAGGLVRVNRATGEVEPLTLDGKPVAPPKAPETPQIHATDQGLVLVGRDGTVTPLLMGGKPLTSAAPKSGLPPEIEAQVTASVGPKPDPGAFPAGAKDPAYLKALEAWGKAVEKIKNDEAQASGAAHGAGYNETRPVAVFDPKTGNFVYMSAKDAEAAGAAPGSLANLVMGKQAQINDIESGSQQLRQALAEPGLTAFTPGQVAKLSLAMRDVDPSAMRNAVTDLFASGLTPQQQDLVASLFSMQERALSLRSVAGMGQGSDQMRRAIIKALPNITSGSTQMALKQLDTFDNLVSNLAKGIGGIKGSAAAPGATPNAAEPKAITQAELAAVAKSAYGGDIQKAKAAAEAQGYTVHE